MPSKFPTTNESSKHRELKKRAGAYLRAQGFNPRAIRYEYRLDSDIRVPQRKKRKQMLFEWPAWLGSTLYVDVVAFDKGKRVAAIEVGECSRQKLIVLTKYFPQVFWWPYGADEPIAFIPTEQDKKWLEEQEEERKKSLQKEREWTLARLREEDPKEAERLEARWRKRERAT